MAIIVCKKWLLFQVEMLLKLVVQRTLSPLYQRSSCTRPDDNTPYKLLCSRQREKIHKCKPFQCECGTKFKNEQDLTAHDCHICKYCNKPYPSKAALTKHTR